MNVQPYLMFEGRAEEAAKFYEKAIDAKIGDFMRYKDAPATDGPPPEGCAPGPDMTPDKIMHMSLKVGEATIMASDGMCSGKPNFQGISLALIAKSEAEANKKFAALGDGGQVQMPLAKTFFSPAFGMVADRFGVSWMVVVM
jgi:PhnB protein